MLRFFLRFFATVAMAALSAACAIGPRQPLSPPQLVGEHQTNIAIEEFMLASVALGRFFGMEVAYTADAVNNSSSSTTGLFGIPLRRDVPYHPKVAGVISPNFKTLRDAVRYYVQTGGNAARIVCRNYLSGLKERNEYFEFVQKELGIAAGLTTVTLQLVKANPTLMTAFSGTMNSLNLGLDAYQEFRYLAVDIETIIPIVEAAQIELRDHFSLDKYIPQTFSGAIDVVNKIEYVCSRAGIRGILNKSLIQARPGFKVDQGILIAIPKK